MQSVPPSSMLLREPAPSAAAALGCSPMSYSQRGCSYCASFDSSVLSQSSISPMEIGAAGSSIAEGVTRL